jgi:O-methyltransferase involved in polyketide biosynthesis
MGPALTYRALLNTQVVVIAAGYDTRAYRLSRPGVKFYEIDLPHASKNKQELVRSLLPANKVRALQQPYCDVVQLHNIATLASKQQCYINHHVQHYGRHTQTC